MRVGGFTGYCQKVKSLAGGKRLHLLVAISYKQGVVMVEGYEKVIVKYFALFVRNKFFVLPHKYY